MSQLEEAIKNAYVLTGSSPEANKAYLEFIKANFFIPVDKNSNIKNPEVLFLQDNNIVFLPAFTNREYFDKWAVEIREEINLLTVSGVDLLKNTGDAVTVCLNIGSPTYKEFNPSELARMRSMVLKFWPNTPNKSQS